uniref:Uncharacterized protein n=1 Tax=Morchella brunnea TaxID=1174671 RepID=A0A8K1I7R3_9PEZI|nr:hypothetical protein LK370_mgp200 [Morchella brunnea]UBU98436.1 hypothetical protein [Morchella brunnea]
MVDPLVLQLSIKIIGNIKPNFPNWGSFLFSTWLHSNKKKSPCVHALFRAAKRWLRPSPLPLHPTYYLRSKLDWEEGFLWGGGGGWTTRMMCWMQPCLCTTTLAREPKPRLYLSQ